ncbi:SURF1 family protein [Novosphingobium sp. BL-8H]|uniref:SURF1 family protein n=1 Tax=Novosphingobium sp. BL-8H TaxID=3127640 RepID=UPI003757A6F9
MIETNEARRPWGLAAFLLLAIAAFLALGVWQVQRLQWKHALIARVDARVHAAPIPLPADDRLARVKGSDLDYLRVSLQGQYEGKATALVRAATDLGTGYWTMTPLRLEDGRQIWVNRGFVPAGTTAKVAGATTPAGPVSITGLLRSDEPKGSLLQSNQPQVDRWYSRDVNAMAQARGIGAVVPAFVDAQVEQANRPKGLTPVPGLTQIHFPDNHLSYALTWFAMAAMSAMALVFVWRRRRWNG